MKKFILLIALPLAFAFTPAKRHEGPAAHIKHAHKKTVHTVTTIRPADPDPQNWCVCESGDVYWSGGSACCNVSCACGGVNGMAQVYLAAVVCIGPTTTAFASNPPGTAPTFYPYDITTGLNESEPTAEQAMAYNEFKANGVFGIATDQRSVDEAGNIFVIKAGVYKITNYKLQVLADQITE